VLGHCQDLLDGYGGHAFAAGLTVPRSRLPELRERLERLVRERISPEDCAPRLVIDGEMQISECRLDLVEWLERLSPHGIDNPEPLFVARNVGLEGVAAVGGGRHLRMNVRDGTGSIQTIGFGLGELAASLRSQPRADIAFVPTRNEWMGETRVQLKVKGVRPA
jgi:single-stranded-DNA-specific exonuclease